MTDELGNPPISPLTKGGASGGGSHFDKDAVEKRGLIWNGFSLPYNCENVGHCRSLRKNMTPAEKKLWFGFLRGYKYRFLRQRPIDHYIADFYCAKLKLVIEIDGMHHSTVQQQYDSDRTEILKIYGLRIVRFTNDEVMNHFEMICRRIQAISLTPLAKGGAAGGGSHLTRVTVASFT